MDASNGINQKRRLSPVVLILVPVLALVSLLLFFPSSKRIRIDKAKAKFSLAFSSLPKGFLEPLNGMTLASRNGLVQVDLSRPLAVYIFAPRTGNNKSAMLMNEMVNPLSAFYGQEGGVQCPILFAPGAESVGWTLFAKVWLAQNVQQKPLNEVFTLGLGLGTASQSSQSVTRLQKLWSDTPVAVQQRVDTMLVKNQEVAKNLQPSMRIFHEVDGVDYDIPNITTTSDFLWRYFQAFPEQKAKFTP